MTTMRIVCRAGLLPLLLMGWGCSDGRLAASTGMQPALEKCSTTEDHSRWGMKTRAKPGGSLAPRSVTAAEITNWPVPFFKDRDRDQEVPVDDREKQVFALTGYLRMIKMSLDCDLHMQIGDSATGPGPQVVAEIPLGEREARETLIRLLGRPVGQEGHQELKGPRAPHLTVVGYGFLDLSHQNKRFLKEGKDHGTKRVQTIWEIHPVWQVIPK